MSGTGAEVKAEVREFWEEEPCGTEHGEAPEGSPEFFAQVERRRYELEPFIPDYAGFAGSRGRKVLEIGVGMGSDFVRWARAGADAHGVDLTEHAIELTRTRLAHEGLTADLRRADAERLPFEDGTFDRVYSWGVLHHTPDTDRAVREAIRVTRPGGELCVMLYARISWVAFGMWARHALLAGRPFRSLADVLYHHMESLGTTAYTKRELRRMFAGVDEVRIDKVGTPYDRRMAGPLASLTGRWLGWFLVVRGRKPAR
ncbi:MAG TPA: class I SAM-dependent methyltransferase [Thermoleophilaceae bacterium]|jgi:SAM-dependent methyltransferase